MKKSTLKMLAPVIYMLLTGFGGFLSTLALLILPDRYGYVMVGFILFAMLIACEVLSEHVRKCK